MRDLQSRKFWTLIVRGLIMLTAYTAYYLTFPALPSAEAIALFFILPLMRSLQHRFVTIA